MHLGLDKAGGPISIATVAAATVAGIVSLVVSPLVIVAGLAGTAWNKFKESEYQKELKALEANPKFPHEISGKKWTAYLEEKETERAKIENQSYPDNPTKIGYRSYDDNENWKKTLEDPTHVNALAYARRHDELVKKITKYTGKKETFKKLAVPFIGVPWAILQSGVTKVESPYGSDMENALTMRRANLGKKDIYTG